MTHWHKQLKRLGSEEGQALVEYALIIGLVTVFALGSLQLLGTNVSSLLESISSTVADAI